MGTALDRASSVKDLYQRGSAYGIPRREVNGMDLLAVREVVGEAIDLARKDKRPSLIEAETYRYRGHSMSDPGKYRSREEVAKVRQESDPIDRLRTQLIAGGHADEPALKEIDRAIRDVISAATEFAQNSPEPDPAELYTDILVEA
jgi:pyruvate dehydrogenase E1 component alpha subunit